MVQQSGKSSGNFFKNNVHPYNPAFVLVGTYPEEMKLVHTKPCMQLFISPNWKQPKCPTIVEWLNKLWYVHTRNYHAALTRNKLLIHATT